MSNAYLTPRRVAEGALRRWSTETLKLITHAPVPLAVAVTALISSSALLTGVLKDTGSMPGAMLSACIDATGYMLIPLLLAYCAAVARAVDRQEPLFAHLQRLAAHRQSVIHAMGAHLLVGVALNGALLLLSAPMLMLGATEPVLTTPVERTFVAALLSAVIVSMMALGPFFALLMVVGGMPDVRLAMDANLRGQLVNENNPINILLKGGLPALVVALVAVLIDTQLPVGIVAPVSLCVICLFAYVAYRDIYEHQDGNHARHTAAARRTSEAGANG